MPNSNSGQSFFQRGRGESTKDRIKAEQQDGGLVLSPQRRSFLTGCQVQSQPSATEGEDKEGGKQPPSRGDHHRGGKDDRRRPGDHRDHGPEDEFSLRPDGRRVGSGRLMGRGDREDYDRGGRGGFDPRGGGREDRYAFRRRGEDDHPGDVRRDRSRERNKWVHDRASGERDDFGRRNARMGPERGMMGGRNAERDFGSGRRAGSRFPRRSEGESEPEWMSEVVEQGDMMELRGFDDSPEKERQASFPPESARDENNKNSKKQETKPEAEEKGSKQTKDQTEEVTKEANAGFNFDDILQMDSIPGLANILADDSMEAEESGKSSHNKAQQQPRQGSRFTQFFKRSESPERRVQQQQLNLPQAGNFQEDENSRRSSIQDELNLNGGGMNGGAGQHQQHQQPHVRIPSPEESNAFYFAPISPAAKTTSQPRRVEQQQQPQQQQQQQQQQHQSSDSAANPLMELIRGSQQGKFHESRD